MTCVLPWGGPQDPAEGSTTTSLPKVAASRFWLKMSPILPFASHFPYLVLRLVPRKVTLQTALQLVPLSLLAHTSAHALFPPICQSLMGLCSLPSASLPFLTSSVYFLSSAHPPFPSTHVLVALSISHHPTPDPPLPRTKITAGLLVGRELWSGPWGRDRVKSPGVVPASATRGRLVLVKALEAAHQRLQFLQRWLWFPREQASRKQGGTFFPVPLNH